MLSGLEDLVDQAEFQRLVRRQVLVELRSTSPSLFDLLNRSAASVTDDLGCLSAKPLGNPKMHLDHLIDVVAIVVDVIQAIVTTNLVDEKESVFRAKPFAAGLQDVHGRRGATSDYDAVNTYLFRLENPDCVDNVESELNLTASAVDNQID